MRKPNPAIACGDSPAKKILTCRLEAIYSSEWTIRRMERAEGGLKPLTLKSLLVAYGVTDVRKIDAFLALARDTSRPGW
jgi:hypothetical protein